MALLLEMMTAVGEAPRERYEGTRRRDVDLALRPGLDREGVRPGDRTTDELVFVTQHGDGFHPDLLGPRAVDLPDSLHCPTALPAHCVPATVRTAFTAHP